MRFLYALAALAVLSSPALAQTQEEQEDPELVVDGSAALDFAFNSLTLGPADLPGTYFPQDTSLSLYVGASLFTANNDGVTGIGTVYSFPGVTSQAVVALQADGSQALGCTANGVGDTPPPSDIVNSFSGRIVMIRRGVCSFIYKVQNAQAGGAIGIVIYNGDDRKGPAPSPVGDVIGNMIGAADFTAPLTIPAILIPNGIGQPIVDEILAGMPVTLTIRQFMIVAAEEGPSTTDSGLEVAGANPFTGSTALRLYTENAETVRVDVYNVRGQYVSTLFNGGVAGERTVAFPSAGLAPGVYFVRATGETFTKQEQVTIIR